MADGRVEAWIEGHQAAVDALLCWLERMTAPGHVDGCEIETVDCAGFEAFEIRR